MFNLAASTIVSQILIAPLMGGNTDEVAVEKNIEKLGKVLDIYEDRLSKRK